MVEKPYGCCVRLPRGQVPLTDYTTQGELLPLGYCTRFVYIYVMVPFLLCAHGTLRAAILRDTSTAFLHSQPQAFDTIQLLSPGVPQ